MKKLNEIVSEISDEINEIEKFRRKCIRKRFIHLMIIAIILVVPFLIYSYTDFEWRFFSLYSYLILVPVGIMAIAIVIANQSQFYSEYAEEQLGKHFYRKVNSSLRFNPEYYDWRRKGFDFKNDKEINYSNLGLFIELEKYEYERIEVSKFFNGKISGSKFFYSYIDLGESKLEGYGSSNVRMKRYHSRNVFGIIQNDNWDFDDFYFLSTSNSSYHKNKIYRYCNSVDLSSHPKISKRFKAYSNSDQATQLADKICDFVPLIPSNFKNNFRLRLIENKVIFTFERSGKHLQVPSISSPMTAEKELKRLYNNMVVMLDTMKLFKNELDDFIKSPSGKSKDLTKNI